MKRFNSAKWITENKHGKFNEETLGSENPIGLSNLPIDLAKTAASKGSGEAPDAQSVPGKVPYPAQDLNPSQKQIILVKAFNMALNSDTVGGEYPPGGDIGAIVSADNFIMDGHHRWASALLIKPDASIIAQLIDMPAKDLITALNIYTKGELGISKGNEGQGAISQFTGENIQSQIIDVAEQTGKSPDSPDGKAPGYTIEELKKRISVFGGGDYEAGLAQLKQNSSLISGKEIKDWMPDRSDMPVIDKSKLPDVEAKFKAGELDLKPPFDPATSAQMAKAGMDELTEPQDPEISGASGTTTQADTSSDDKTLGDVEMVLRNIDKINTQQELQQILQKVMNHIAAGNVTGGNFALNKVFGPGPSTAIRKQFGIDETKDSRSSLYKRIEKFINK
jgi:hypothetical protein